MAQTAEQTRQAPPPQVQHQANELVTDQGTTTIADIVVAKVAGIAAREVNGIHDLVSQGVGGTIAGLAQQVTGSQQTIGVQVQVGQREALIALTSVVDYGVSIPQVAEAVRQNVINRVQSMTGLKIKAVNIDVVDLYFPERQGQTSQSQQQAQTVH